MPREKFLRMEFMMCIGFISDIYLQTLHSSVYFAILMMNIVFIEVIPSLTILYM